MNTDKKIVIIDYGVGNLWSLENALRQFAQNVTLTEEKEIVEKADAIILPGVGAFRAGMEGLAVRGLIEPIKDAAKRGVPIFGICLGAQLLLEKGFEFGEHEGLGLIPGTVEKFPDLAGAKIPAIGWQEVEPRESSIAQALFAGLEAHSSFYFLHSYVLKPSDVSAVLADTNYGGMEYVAAVGKGKIFGTQFHPERSGAAGLKLLQNFISSV